MECARIERQRKIDEVHRPQRRRRAPLRDRPYEDKTKVRVAGPFTVESLSPHRTVPMDDEPMVRDGADTRSGKALTNDTNFVDAVIDNLKTSGVQQTVKEDRIEFDGV